jgi:hypothetical protein
MIITKKRFNLMPGCRRKWPFTVPEVTVEMLLDHKGKEILFGLVHRFGRFALSGALENFGFDKLVNSGIWADVGPGVKRDLTPFFGYIQTIAVREFGKDGDGQN